MPLRQRRSSSATFSAAWNFGDGVDGTRSGDSRGRDCRRWSGNHGRRPNRPFARRFHHPSRLVHVLFPPGYLHHRQHSAHVVAAVAPPVGPRGSHGDTPRMAIKADRWIKRMALEHGMIEPFVESQMRENVVSFGLSSYGYDIRVADEFKVFTNVFSTVIDPKKFDPRSFVDIKAEQCIIPPNSFALARTIEYFRVPRDVLTVSLGKSTYARCGIIVNVTPFEPEWEGHVTIEISNTTPLPARIYSNEGIAQVLFFQSDEVCEVSYKDKSGKYQAQRGVTLPKI